MEAFTKSVTVIHESGDPRVPPQGPIAVVAAQYRTEDRAKQAFNHVRAEPEVDHRGFCVYRIGSLLKGCILVAVGRWRGSVHRMTQLGCSSMSKACSPTVSPSSFPRKWQVSWPHAGRIASKSKGARVPVSRWGMLMGSWLAAVATW